MQIRSGSFLLALGLMVMVLCTSALAADVAADTADMDKININTAPADELILLKGIGKVNAGKIIDFRVSHGQFKTIEDLMMVPGIGKKTFEKNKDRIKVE